MNDTKMPTGGFRLPIPKPDDLLKNAIMLLAEIDNITGSPIMIKRQTDGTVFYMVPARQYHRLSRAVCLTLQRMGGAR